MQKVGKIYVIKNSITDSVYVGQTVQSLSDRFKRHLRISKSLYTGAKLYEAIRDIGEEYYKIQLICTCDIIDMDRLEIEHIRKYDSYHNGYNSTPGGENRKSTFMDLDIDSFTQDYNSNMKILDMAKKYDCDVRTIYSIRRSLSIESNNNKGNTRTNGWRDKKLVEYDKYFNPIKLYNSIGQVINEHNGNKNWYGEVRQACERGNISQGHRWQILKELEYTIDDKTIYFNTIFDKQLYKSNTSIKLIDSKGLLKCEGIVYADYVGESARESCKICGSILNKHNICNACAKKAMEIHRPCCNICGRELNRYNECSACNKDMREQQMYTENYVRLEQIRKIASEGLSLTEMSKLIDITGNGIKKICLRYNIEYRTKHIDIKCRAINIITGKSIVFNSIGEAAGYLTDEGLTSISKYNIDAKIKIAMKSGKTLYGYKWESV